MPSYTVHERVFVSFTLFYVTSFQIGIIFIIGVTTDELTFIENSVINFSHTLSLHCASGVDFSHIWLARSALLSVLSAGDLLVSWL